ncbi:hypothetical protein DCCM_2432 [Desulfocucumis palustris]|uniref:Uncharacterized protein n=1 Tax=Desulfocucumis palustris TaxID=1898651 RepID=A0A2L2XCC1_9FIRM|nr:hypothetical protein DCCM_2432 [Desulfocucumis palustris]
MLEEDGEALFDISALEELRKMLHKHGILQIRLTGITNSHQYRYPAVGE